MLSRDWFLSDEITLERERERERGGGGMLSYDTHTLKPRLVNFAKSISRQWWYMAGVSLTQTLQV